MKQAKYLLLGGGYTLSRLAEKLDPRLFVITCRSDQKLNKFNSLGYNALKLELGNQEQIDNLFSEYSDLEFMIDSIPPIDRENIQLKTFLEKVRSTKIKRVIYFSTTGVFGVLDGSWVNEMTKVNPTASRSLARLDAEKLYESLNLDFISFRIAAIYGPERGIKVSLKQKNYCMLECGDNWSNRIHVDDIVETCLKTLDLSNKIPPLLCLSDDKPDQIKNIVKFYCDKFNYDFPLSITKEEAFQKGMHSIFSNQRVDNSLLKRIMGKDLLFPDYIKGSEKS